MILRWLMCGLIFLHAGSAPARVIVIGIDGGSWNVVDPMLESGELPNLHRLINRGGSAELDTVEPIISPVVWTSIATGRSPEAYRVTDFFSTRAMIAVPTIYERLAAQGLRVGLYEVLMSWPPPPMPGGFVVPGWLRRDELMFTTVFDVAERPPRVARSFFERARQRGVARMMDWVFDTKIDPTAHAMLVALPRGSILSPLWPDGQIWVDGVQMPLHRAIYRQRFTGSHDPTAIFVAAGGAIEQQSKRDRLSSRSSGRLATSSRWANPACRLSHATWLVEAIGLAFASHRLGPHDSRGRK